MIRILLNGCCGKMGRVISDTVKNHPELSIVCGIDKNNNNCEYPVFKAIEECSVTADVILDFSRPDALPSLLKYALAKNVPIVLCTTGFSTDDIALMKDYSNKIPVFRSANMSIGINIINNILKSISAKLYEDFDIEIIEKHHNQKVDAPSGTAVLLGNTIKDAISDETVFTYGREGNCKRTHNEIGIHDIRGGSIVGEHEIIFAGQGETIEIKHTAISREVFAVGALKACSFMCGKGKGFYSMDDVVK
jgi:4-hydroxy-tetrahydrodipicolinate reductase